MLLFIYIQENRDTAVAIFDDNLESKVLSILRNSLKDWMENVIFFLFAVERNLVVMEIVNVNFLSATTTYRMLEDISENYLNWLDWSFLPSAL